MINFRIRTFYTSDADLGHSNFNSVRYLNKYWYWYLNKYFLYSFKSLQVNIRACVGFLYPAFFQPACLQFHQRSVRCLR